MDIQLAAPWIDATLDDKGAELVLDDVPSDTITVRVEGPGRPKGALVQVRWFGVGDGSSPTPPYETDWQIVTRDGFPMTFEIPVRQANLRPGTVFVSYTMLTLGSGSIESEAKAIVVTARGMLAPADIGGTIDDPVIVDPGRSALEIIAPRQPELIPPASRVRFFWEAEEPGPDRGRGWDECFAPDGSDAIGALSLGALTRLQGRHMRLWYEVDTYTPLGIHLSHEASEPIVRAVQGDSSLLPAPDIPGITAGTLRLLDFPTEVPVHIAAWPGIAEGQLVWVTFDGVTADGDARIDVAQGEPVTLPMLAQGFATSVSTARLPAWRDGSVVTLRAAVAFAGSTRDEASPLPLLTITYVRDAGNEGRAVELESFDGLVTLKAGETQRLRFATLRQSVGQLNPYPATSTSSYMPYLKDTSAILAASGGSTTRITLDHPAPRVRIGIGVPNSMYPGTLLARDRHGDVLTSIRLERTGFVDVAADEGLGRIATLDIGTSGSNSLMFDNLIAFSGNPWVEAAGRISETFDDLPLGEHGESMTFQRWSISAEGGSIAIIADALTGHGSSLSVRMAPAGRVHYLTPRLGSRPRVRAEMRLRTSSGSHSATFEIVLINTADLTSRVFKQMKTIGPGQVTVAFDATQLPGDDEYLSHFRVIHDSGTAVRAVIYDDIVLD